MVSQRSVPGWLRDAAVVLALAALYVVTARLGLLLAIPPAKKATAVWVPSGLALAGLLLAGHRAWPGVWLGAFLANLWDAFDPANPFPLSAHLLTAAGIAIGSTLQALAGRHLVRRWVGSGSPFDRAGHVFAFAAVAMLACLVAATCGVASLYLGGFVPAQAVGFAWWTWWLGDATGVLTAGSLVWATFRFGQHGAVTALCLTSGLAVLGPALGRGPFAQPTVQTSLLLLQVFMGVIAVTVLVMAAVLSERRASQDALGRSERRYRALVQATPQVVWVIGEDGMSAEGIAWWQKVTGQPAEQAAGWGWLRALHPDDRGRVRAAWQHAVETKSLFDRQYRVRAVAGGFRHRAVAGGFRHLAACGVPLSGPGGRFEEWVGTLTDVTDRVRADEALRQLNATLERRVADRTEAVRQQEERFRTAFEYAPIGTALVAPDGRWLRVNRSVCDIVVEGDPARLGRTAHPLEGMLGNLSATASCEAATRLEVCARGGHMTDAPGAYRALEAEIERLHVALAELGPCMPCPNGERP